MTASSGAHRGLLPGGLSVSGESAAQPAQGRGQLHACAASLLRRWLERQTLPLPRGKATQQGADIGESIVHQLLCHTGTLLLLASGAVENQLRVARQLVAAGVYLPFWKGDSAGGMGLVVGGPASDVDQESLTPLRHVVSLLDRDPDDIRKGLRLSPQRLGRCYRSIPGGITHCCAPVFNGNEGTHDNHHHYHPNDDGDKE